MGRVSQTNPPAQVPGMVSVQLDLRGRLLAFHAVPELGKSAGDGKPAAAPKADWKPFFDAAKLDMARFADAAPTWVPPVFADERKAWEGTDAEEPEKSLRIEAAAFQGKPVFFQIIQPWTLPQGVEPENPYTADTALIMWGVPFLLVLACAAVLGPRNLLQGRADSRGALHLALYTFGLMMVVWFFEARHLFAPMQLRLILQGLVVALYWAAVLGMAYLAVEPFVRRLWPEALISWSRLMAGQWRDPRVGRDFLVGALTGAASYLLFQVGMAAPGWLGQPARTPYWDNWIPNGVISGYWMGDFLVNQAYAFRTALVTGLLTLLLLRLVLRKNWLAAPFFVVWVMIYHGEQVGLPNVGWPFFALQGVVLLVVLLRFGLLAAIIMQLAYNTLLLPFSPDPSAWYARGGYCAVGFVLALALYGFFTSLRRQPLLGNLNLEGR
jgi:serine/threonine-protein kinase